MCSWASITAQLKPGIIHTLSPWRDRLDDIFLCESSADFLPESVSWTDDCLQLLSLDATLFANIE